MSKNLIENWAKDMCNSQKDIKMANKHENIFQFTHNKRNVIKLQRDSISRLSDWRTFRSTTTRSISEAMKKHTLSCVAGENVNEYNPFGEEFDNIWQTSASVVQSNNLTYEDKVIHCSNS